MTTLITAYLITGALALAVTLLGLRGQGPAWRLCSVAGFVGLLVASYVGYDTVIGRAKPDNDMIKCLPDNKVVVLFAFPDEPKAIYVLIDVGSGPRLCELPWSTEAAQQLQ